MLKRHFREMLSFNRNVNASLKFLWALRGLLEGNWELCHLSRKAGGTRVLEHVGHSGQSGTLFNRVENSDIKRIVHVINKTCQSPALEDIFCRSCLEKLATGDEYTFREAWLFMHQTMCTLYMETIFTNNAFLQDNALRRKILIT